MLAAEGAPRLNEIGVVYSNGEGITKDDQEDGLTPDRCAHGNPNGKRYLAMTIDRLGEAALARAQARANAIVVEYGIQERNRVS